MSACSLIVTLGVRKSIFYSTRHKRRRFKCCFCLYQPISPVTECWSNMLYMLRGMPEQHSSLYLQETPETVGLKGRVRRLKYRFVLKIRKIYVQSVDWRGSSYSHWVSHWNQTDTGTRPNPHLCSYRFMLDHGRRQLSLNPDRTQRIWTASKLCACKTLIFSNK